MSRPLNQIRSIRFSHLDIDQLTIVASRRGVTVGWLIRSMVRNRLDADAAEFYADPNNRRTVGPGIRREDHWTIGTGSE